MGACEEAYGVKSQRGGPVLADSSQALQILQEWNLQPQDNAPWLQRELWREAPAWVMMAELAMGCLIILKVA